MFMFCVLRITETQTGNIIFKEELSASPFKMRPLFLVLGKECTDNLKDVEICVKERQTNQQFALEMENGTSHKITLKAEMSMIDAKMRDFGLVLKCIHVKTRCMFSSSRNSVSTLIE